MSQPPGVPGAWRSTGGGAGACTLRCTVLLLLLQQQLAANAAGVRIGRHAATVSNRRSLQQLDEPPVLLEAVMTLRPETATVKGQRSDVHRGGGPADRRCKCAGGL